MRTLISKTIDWAAVAVVYFAVIAWGGKTAWATALLAAGSMFVLACRLITAATTGRVRVLYSHVYLPSAGLILLGLLQILAPRPGLDSGPFFHPHTVEPYTTGLHILLGLSYVALGLSVLHGFHSRRQLVSLIVALFALGIAESLYGLFQYFTGLTSVWDPPFHSDTARGTLANRNHFALLLNVTLTAGVAYLYVKSSELVPHWKMSRRRLLSMPDLPRLIWIVAWIALIGLGIVFSLSRTGVAAMLASIAVMLVAARTGTGTRRATLVVAAVLCAIVGLGVYAGIGEVLERYAAIGQPGYLEHYRVPTWRDAWTMIHANPWFGQGLGSFQWTFPAYESLDPDTPAVYAHNDYLQVLAESGIVGLGLVLWLLFTCCRSAARNLRSDDPLVRGLGLATLGALAAAAIQEITDYSLYTPGVAATLICLVALNERVSWLQLPAAFSNGAPPPLWFTPGRRPRRPE